MQLRHAQWPANFFERAIARTIVQVKETVLVVAQFCSDVFMYILAF